MYVNKVTIEAQDVRSIKDVAQQLRVPEFKYCIDDSSDLVDAINQFIQLNRTSPENRFSPSLCKSVVNTFKLQSLPPNFVNCAFIVDRVFDVWLRKNKLEKELNGHLSDWRYVLLDILYHDNAIDLLQTFATLVDTVSGCCIGWSEHPHRSKQLWLDELKLISDTLYAPTQPDDGALRSALQSWQSYFQTQQEKEAKIVTRLVVSERQAAQTRFAKAKSQQHINSLFENKIIPDSVQQFLEQCWLDVMTSVYDVDIDNGASIKFEELSEKLKRVYTGKGDSAFEQGNTILDELINAAEDAGVRGAEEVWANLEKSLVSILQKIPVEEKLFKSLSFNEEFTLFKVAGEGLPVKNQWYQIKEDEHVRRVKVAELFTEFGQILLTNYLGMKHSAITAQEFSYLVKQGELKPLKPEADFSSVVKSAIAGLLKVAKTQKAARVKAAEKARYEVEQLLEAKRLAEEDAKVRAADIARRTKQIQIKKAEKKRLEEEQAILSQVSAFKLGAWISVNIGDEKMRYRLAVKFSASRKFLFVDKLGIKKLEYIETDLVSKILSGTIEVLSDGAEFEDSLERVVSRIRLAK